MSFLCYSTKYRWRGLGARIKPDRPVASIVKPLGDSDGKECQAETLKGGKGSAKGRTGQVKTDPYANPRFQNGTKSSGKRSAGNTMHLQLLV